MPAMHLCEYTGRVGIGHTMIGPADLELEHDSTVSPDVFATMLVDGRRPKHWKKVTGPWLAFEAVPIRLVAVEIGRAIATAIERGLYAYDAYMLELARHRGLPLLTLDQRLGAAATASGLALVEY